MGKLFIAIIAVFALCIGCNNDDNEPDNPTDQLPPATQTGAQTFGCLINGEPFLPKNFGQNRLNVFVQTINGNYYLGMISSSSDNQTIIVGATEVQDLKPGVYSLSDEEPGSFSASYKQVVNSTESINGKTTSESPGTITITKFDPVNFILSGNFEFKVKDENNNLIKITDGRFDLIYTN